MHVPSRKLKNSYITRDGLFRGISSALLKGPFIGVERRLTMAIYQLQWLFSALGLGVLLASYELFYRVEQKT